MIAGTRARDEETREGTGRRAAYAVSTGIVAFALVAGGIADLLRVPVVAQGMAELGYPVYICTILGGWKLLGAAALLAPGLPRIKEWAYAGTVFNMTGAVISHLAVGQPIGKAFPAALFAALAVVSWATRPTGRRLEGAGLG